MYENNTLDLSPLLDILIFDEYTVQHSSSYPCPFHNNVTALADQSGFHAHDITGVQTDAKSAIGTDSPLVVVPCSMHH